MTIFLLFSLPFFSVLRNSFISSSQTKLLKFMTCLAISIAFLIKTCLTLASLIKQKVIKLFVSLKDFKSNLMPVLKKHRSKLNYFRKIESLYKCKVFAFDKVLHTWHSNNDLVALIIWRKIMCFNSMDEFELLVSMCSVREAASESGLVSSHVGYRTARFRIVMQTLIRSRMEVVKLR